MASAVRPKYKASLLNGTNSAVWTSDTIKISIGRKSAYTYAGTDQFKSAVTTVQDASAALSSKTATTPADGVADAADATFSTVSAGAALDFLEVWKDTGSGSTSPLIVYIDLGSGVTPNGGDITVQFDSGANRIFAL